MTSYDNLKKATLIAVVAAALSLGLSIPASATLIGDTITITTQANVPLDTWSDSVLVGAGIEMMGVADPFAFVPFSDTGSAINHANPFLSGAQFPHLFLNDFYDIGASSITIHYEALGGPEFLYAFNTDFSDLDWTDMPGTLQNVTVASESTGLVNPPNISMITASSFRFQAQVDLATGANIILNLIAVHVPEPTTLSLATLALLGLLAHGRRRRA